MIPEATYQRERARARRRPAWWLRRRQATIIAIRPYPTADELAELGAIRRELHIRSTRKAPLRWWALW